MTISDTPGEWLDPKAVAWRCRRIGDQDWRLTDYINPLTDLDTWEVEPLGVIGSDAAGLPSDRAGLDAAARALVAEYRSIWPRAGFPALREAKMLVRAAIAALSRATEATCLCDRCGSSIEHDVHVPDEVWAKISPKPVEGFKGGGLLCAQCIVTALATPTAPQPALALIEELERALEPFAEVASEWDGEPASLHVFLEWNDEKAPVPSLPVDLFRAARTALASAKRFKGA